MTGRTLLFVERAADAGPPDPVTDVVVLDPWWTAEPGGRADLTPIRPVAQMILDRVDLGSESLAGLDEWAGASGLADRFVVDGITWWFRVRMAVRWDLQELMLWRHALAILAPPARYAVVAIPESRTTLLGAARALGRLPGAPSVVPMAPPEIPVGTPAAAAGPTTRPSLAAIVRRRLGRILRRGRMRVVDPPRRAAILEARLDALVASRPLVLAIAWAGAFQVVQGDGRRRFIDPHLALVMDRLAAEGCTVATIAMGLDPRKKRDWAMLAEDGRLLPHALVRDRWRRLEDEAVDAGPVPAALADAAPVPLDVEGCDLGPEMRAAVEAFGGSWLEGQRRWTSWAERCLAVLRPSVLYLDRDGTRTTWIAAARRVGIPVVSVQHGMIYPGNPEYCHPPHPGMVRPDRTCVFGSFERDILVEQGGYDPADVIVTGSPRSDIEASASRAREDRKQARRELGIAEGDRMLVVSVAHNAIGELHGATMAARLLGGPLPGIHVVFKLHPQDATGGGYRALLEGLSRAGGHDLPRHSVVRDVDLYRLLGAADAHLGQDSTVLTDAVVAGIPNMIAVGQARADTIGYVAAGVAVPVRSIDDVRAFMADPRPPTAEDRARFLDAHFLRGDATGRIAQAIRDLANGAARV